MKGERENGRTGTEMKGKAMSVGYPAHGGTDLWCASICESVIKCCVRPFPSYSLVSCSSYSPPFPAHPILFPYIASHPFIFFSFPFHFPYLLFLSLFFPSFLFHFPRFPSLFSPSFPSLSFNFLSPSLPSLSFNFLSLIFFHFPLLKFPFLPL